MKLNTLEIKNRDLNTVEDMINTLMEVPKDYALNPMGEKCAIAIDNYHECVYLDHPNWIDEIEYQINYDIGKEVDVDDNKLKTYSTIADKDRAEFLSQIMNAFEDFLEEKGIVFPNTKDLMIEAGCSDEEINENTAILYGDNYWSINDRIENLLIAWDILK